MKKTVLAVFACLMCLTVAADVISLFGSNVEIHSRSAASVTGPQSNVISTALQPESTNGWDVSAHQNWLTSEADATAIAALHQFAATGKTTVVSDTFDPTVFTRWENGTGFVYRVTDTSHWNEDGVYQPENAAIPYPLVACNNEQIVITVDGQYASVLISNYSATDVPTNSTSFEAYYVANVDPLEILTNLYEYVFTAETNSVASLATAAELADARVDFTNGLVSAVAQSIALNDITGARISALRLTSSQLPLFVDLTATNMEGYASFSTTNPVSQQTVTVIPGSVVATNTVSLRYDVGVEGFVSATTVLYGRGQSIEQWTTVLSLHDAAGAVLASNVCYGALPTSTAVLPYFTNALVWSESFVTNTYLTLDCRMSKTNATGTVCYIAAGDAVASTLAVRMAPLPYLTFDQAQGATNLVLNGVRQTYDDATRTLTGTVSAGTAEPSISVAVTNIPVVAAGATNVVTLSNAYGVYIVTATNTLNFLTNSNGGLSLSGKLAEWELWVDFTNPAGTNMTWCPCMQFDVVPEITATGLYKFACSSYDGTKALTRQTWPDTQAYVPLYPQAVWGGDAYNGIGGNRLLTLGTKQDGLIQYLWPARTADPVMVSVVAAAAITTGTAAGAFGDWKIEMYNGNVYPIETNRCPITSISSNVGGPAITRNFIVDATDTPASSMIRLRRIVVPGDTLSTNCNMVVSVLYRPLTRTERAAYDAGWRP